MKNFNNFDIAYLEIDDISNGKLKSYVTKGKPTIVMAQGSGCTHCTKAKPDFAEFSKKTKGEITSATIKIDGKQSEQDLAKWLGKWDKDYKGVPLYLLFGPNGTYKGTHNGGRDLASLLKAI
jgi:thiol-disulfide isomerase/thioredoxin